MIRRTACLVARSADPFRCQAVERHLMDTLPEDTVLLYLWQVKRTLLLGRCQDAFSECNVQPFLSGGGTIARRLSGGGTFYADEGVLGFSVLMPKEVFSLPQVLEVPGRALAELGIRTRWNGKETLSVSGRALCKNSFYKEKNLGLHHGIIFTACDIGSMADVLTTPDKPALSVPVHTINTTELNPDATADVLSDALSRALGDTYGCSVNLLSEDLLDESGVRLWRERFMDTAYLFPNVGGATVVAQEQYPWGSFKAELLSEGGIIRAAHLYTDALEAALFQDMEQALIGSPFLISAISGRVRQRLGGLSNPRLLQMVSDSLNLICGQIRAMDRIGER